jgi:glutathione peroxidase-family protein
MEDEKTKSIEILFTQQEAHLIYRLMTVCIHNLKWNYETHNFFIDRKIVIFKDFKEFDKAKEIRQKLEDLIETGDNLPF